MTAPTPFVEGTDVLAAAVRRLIDATVRTQVGPDVVASAAEQVDALTRSLSASMRTGPYHPDVEAPFTHPQNIVMGAAHPVAPPLTLAHGPDGVHGTVRLGTTYEGPPGLVHGGVLALLMDHALGLAGLAAGFGGMTAKLTTRYLAPTPLHTDLDITARFVEETGKTARIEGQVAVDGQPTVRAEGVFVLVDERRAAALFPHLVR